ncbi:ROK family protein [Planococcus lenghuensis]|uniref:Transcriptional regulator n=1 Tax=Planococcus lenghuensis TaxID=2213202 RepID=A0A1Q2L0R4_9BACL|nr:ROK family protein [Planococcus lenghuensis]AQQ54021.1 transcriptional regulator [Planococcus lenghuensis]
MKYAVGVDIGGTKAAAAVVAETGEILKKTVIPTDGTVAPEEMIERISRVISKLIKETGLQAGDLSGIGIGAPGPLDTKRGAIHSPPYLPRWIDVPVVQLMAQRFSIPVLLENDANAAALAEKWLGAARGLNDFVYVTVSTGIGAGIVSDGRLVSGRRGNAGEIGHMVVDPSFGRCFCGLYGCLELIASGTSIAKHGSVISGRTLSTKEVFDLYRAGDAAIMEFVDRVFHALGTAAVSLVNTFDPEAIIIGGGVSQVGDPLFKAVQTHISRYALDAVGRQTQVVPAQLNQSEGVIGAAALCFQPGS